MNKTFLLLGSINAFLAVGLGAFGAHGLRSKISQEMLAIYQTGIQYHMFHAMGLMIVGLVFQWISNSSAMVWAGWSMVFGILIFCGSLYALSISGLRWFGAITPLGVLGFLVGWFLFAYAIFKQSVSS